MTFDLYRDDLTALGTGNVGQCLETGLTTTGHSDPDEPLHGNGYLYLVAGRQAAVGSLGYRSDGTERVPYQECP